MKLTKIFLLIPLSLLTFSLNANELSSEWNGTASKSDCHGFISDTLKKRKNNIFWCAKSKKTCKGMYKKLKPLCKKNNIKRNAKECTSEWTEKYIGGVCEIMSTKKIKPREEQIKELKLKEKNLEILYEEFQKFK